MAAEFSLTKWYVDVVSDDGSVAIAYWAEISWKSLRHAFCALLLHPADGAPVPWQFSGRSVPPPTLATHGLRWDAEPLMLTAEFVRCQPAFEHRLLDAADGVVDWHCEVPRAEVRFRTGKSVIEGTGYAERLELTVLPWRIPADEIRWGRFLAAETSIVWIDWRGEHPQRLVFHDGHLTPAASISDEGLSFGSGLHLSLDNRRVVNADVLGGLLAPLEVLRPLVTPIAHTHQTRWLSHGQLRGSAGVCALGWSLHELVRRR